MPTRIDDGADSLPADPTATATEVDYAIRGTQAATSTKIVTTSPELVKPDGPEVKVENRVTFSAIVVKINDTTSTPRSYDVLRSDLKRLTAYMISNETGYQDLRVGDQVTIQAGSIQGQWYITGCPRQNALPTYTYKCVGQASEGDLLIVFNGNALYETGFDGTLSVDDDGNILVKCDDSIEVEILLQLTISCEIPVPNDIINIVTDVRLSDTTLDLNIGQIEGRWLSPPVWVAAISLTKCGTY